MQQKQIKDPLIVMLNVELELKAEKENAEVRVTNVRDYQDVVDAEWEILYEKLESCYKAGAKVTAQPHFRNRKIIREFLSQNLTLSLQGRLIKVANW